jgi:UDP-GlcNAc3NAcA epimerase
MKIVSIVGARPEFIQALPVSLALRSWCEEILVHTGQHYDYLMSQAFFDELGVPSPDYNLGVGSGSHGKQTAQILLLIEDVLLNERPDLVIVRGDTNSTIAGALAAAKLKIPIAHIEAGERSYNRRMPEEINRVVTDSVADHHFCASMAASDRLSDEGITKSVHWVGDVMLDSMLRNLPLARKKSDVLDRLNLRSTDYTLVTIHRASNTDNPNILRRIVQTLNQTGDNIIFPIHPRTRSALKDLNIAFSSNVKIIDPIGYFDIVVLEENARLIATDSGGVQREAYFLGIPCLTLRNETEWIETVQTGWNRLVGTRPRAILEAWYDFEPPDERPPIFGEGAAGQRISDILHQLYYEPASEMNLTPKNLENSS